MPGRSFDDDLAECFLGCPADLADGGLVQDKPVEGPGAVFAGVFGEVGGGEVAAGDAGACPWFRWLHVGRDGVDGDFHFVVAVVGGDVVLPAYGYREGYRARRY